MEVPGAGYWRDGAAGLGGHIDVVRDPADPADPGGVGGVGDVGDVGDVGSTPTH